MKLTPWKTALGTALSAALIAAPLAAVPANAVEAAPAAAGTSPVVINEAYLSGGSSGAAFKNKFVELYNGSDAPVSLEGWSLQYRSATGHRGAELGGGPDRQHSRQGLLPAQGRQQRHGRRRPAGRRRHRHRLQPGRWRRHDRAGQAGRRAQPAADRLGHRTGQRRGPARLRHLQHLRDPGGRCAVGQHRRQEPEPQQRRGHQQQLRRLHAQRRHHAEGGQRWRLPAPWIRPWIRAPGTPPAAKTIAEIQGTGAASPLAGSSVTTRGRVTATFPTGGFAGYYVQTPGTGGDLTPANHAASDAVFVYSPSTVDSVRIGDYVETHRRRQRILRHDPAERRRGGRSEEAHRGRPRGQGHRLRAPRRRGLP